MVDIHEQVIIDVNQAVKAINKNNMGKLLIRELDNLSDFFSQYTLTLKSTQYVKEMWPC